MIGSALQRRGGEQKLRGALRLGLRRSWNVPRFTISLRHIRQVCTETTRTGNESIAIRGERDNRASTSDISEGGMGRADRRELLGLNCIELKNAGISFLSHSIYCLLFALRTLSSIFPRFSTVAAAGMHFIRVMLGHAEEHPSCTYVCGLDVGGGLPNPVRRNRCVRSGRIRAFGYQRRARWVKCQIYRIGAVADCV